MAFPGDQAAPSLCLCEMHTPNEFKKVVKLYFNPKALESIFELECGHLVSVKTKIIDLPFIGKVPSIDVKYYEKKEEEPTEKKSQG